MRARFRVVMRFHRFLHENKALDKYYTEVERAKIMSVETAMEMSPELFILAPFIWTESKDGYYFWNEIDKKWVTVITEEIWDNYLSSRKTATKR